MQKYHMPKWEIVHILRVNQKEEKQKQNSLSDDPTVHFLDASDEWKKQNSRRQ
jgi:hypothetical protein